MGHFYDAWNPRTEGAKPVELAEALRRAQVAVQKDRKAPAYWAAWVLWGVPE